MNYRLATNKESFSFKKNDIIRNKDEISRIFKKGKRIYLAGVTIYLHPAIKSRACFLVKKDAGNAVTRNRYKRWFREIYRKNRDLFGSNEVMFYINRQILLPGVNFNHYDHEIKNHFSKKNQ